MKQNMLSIFAVCLMLCFASDSFAWQGRISGMDNPSGLVADESDFLTHPAKIIDGIGSNYYADYKFDYIQVPKWDYISTYTYNHGKSVLFHIPFMASGSERDHDVSLGGTWALGTGRLGIFVKYSHTEGSYTGSSSNGFGLFLIEHEPFALGTDAQSLAVKILYGFPVGTWKLGTEIGFAHKSHSNYIAQSLDNGGNFINVPMNALSAPYDFFIYIMPGDASWNEASFKASAEETIGSGVLTFTPRIATVFHGVSNVNISYATAYGESATVNGAGNVSGWSTGADLWYHIKLNDTTSLPFVVSANYDRKKTDVSTVAITNYIGVVPDTETSEAKQFIFEIGGGVYKQFTKETKVASGLYYEYLQSKDFYATIWPLIYGGTTAHNEYPAEKEHRLVFKLAGEHVLSPKLTARAGLNAFFGWVGDHYNLTQAIAPIPSIVQDIRTSGHRWGLTGAVGATMKAAKLDIEPFITTGIQKNSGDTNSGSFVLPGIPSDVIALQSRKSIWSVGGGVSVRY